MRPRPVPLHPATTLVLAACGWVVVISLNQVLISLTVAALALALGTWGSRSFALIAASLALTFPVALSMIVIHAPYGQEQLAPLVTLDGLLLAGRLTVRFLALVSCFLAAAATANVSEVSKWLQTSRAGHKVSYVVGASLQSIPQGNKAVRIIREANKLRGRRVTLTTLFPRVVIPLVARLLVEGAARGEALSAVGFDIPGKRTVLVPVPDSRAQRVARILVPLCCAIYIVWAWGG